MNANSGLTLTMVSHACIRIDGDFGALLCDPWIVNEPVYNFTTWKFPDVTLSPDEILDGITHLFISHAHEDHFHVPSLDLISRDVTVLLPEYSWHPGLRAQTIELTMRRLGFANIHKFMPWQTAEIGGDVSLTFIPAARSKPQDWENSALVIDHPSTRILNVNDCPTDEELYSGLRERYDRFDLALIQYAGVSSFPGRFKYDEPEMQEIVRNRRANFDEQDRAAENLDVDYIIPFAGDFCWLDDTMLHCNWASRATPVLFEQWCSENHSEKSFELMLMNPSDVWSKLDGLQRNLPPVDWDNYLNGIAELKKRKQPKLDATNAWLAASDRKNMRVRTDKYLSTMQDFTCREYIDFSATIRFKIDGPDAAFSFVLEADPTNGFRAGWNDDVATDHTCHLSEVQWASVLEGKIMFNNLHWTGIIEQHVPFRLDMAKFWWWLEYYADLTNRGPQVILQSQQFPELDQFVEPQRGQF